MEDCIFCKIINKEIESEIVYEDDKVIAFNDVNPKAPVHILVIPKEHIPTLNDINNPEIVGYIFEVIKKLAKEKGIDESGYRVVANCNKEAGQSVYHIHFHLLGGRSLQWPPG